MLPRATRRWARTGSDEAAIEEARRAGADRALPGYTGVTGAASGVRVVPSLSMNCNAL